MTHNTIAFPPKHPTSKLDYEFDWSAWLPTGDTIASVAWTITGSVTNVATSNTDTTATIWLSGGTAGETVTIQCKITTANAQPRIESAYGTIRIQA